MMFVDFLIDQHRVSRVLTMTCTYAAVDQLCALVHGNIHGLHLLFVQDEQNVLQKMCTKNGWGIGLDCGRDDMRRSVCEQVR